MNPEDLSTAVSLATGVAKEVKGLKNVEVGVVPPFPFIHPVSEALKGSGIKIGAQQLFIEDKGAFTGAVSGTMLKSLGCDYVLCGHSERRVIFKESNELINQKVHKVLSKGMNAILCIGESKEEYESGLNRQVCAHQLEKNLKAVSEEQMGNVIIAYEPVWAIGTGLTATPEIAQGVHSYIRSWVSDKYGKDIANAVRIQYGGSVTPESVDDLMACPDIDGALVGGASLVSDKFGRICRFNAVKA